MKLAKQALEEMLVVPGQAANLAKRSTAGISVPWMGGDGQAHRKVAERDLRDLSVELAGAQERFWANGTHSLLVIFQAMDAAGKDGTIKHVMSGVNPQGCAVHSFKQPSRTELGHDFLWRCSAVLPERGMIGIFNRSYYEDVLVTRVHPELLGGEDVEVAKGFWKGRFDDINAFEHHLVREGTVIVKLFLHVSRDVQKRRFLERLDDPAKYWKFSAADVAEREHWDAYQDAYERALSATSTSWAPWYVVPADHKFALRALSGRIIVGAIDGLDLVAPTPGAEALAEIERARATLEAE